MGHEGEVPAYLHRLELPTPFAVGPVNVYLAFGPEGPTLIDTGPRTTQTHQALVSGLASLGLRPEEIRRVVVTHAHVDHYGLAGLLVRQAGAEVWTHPENEPTLSDDPAARARRDAFYGEVLARSGVPARDRERIAAIYKGFRHLAEPVGVTRYLEEGQSVHLGGEVWQVLHMPGHSGGLICLWEPGRRVLLSSDHLLPDITSNPLLEPPPREGEPRRRSLRDYLASLQRTLELAPVLALPGHGAPIEDPAALIRERFRFHEERQKDIMACLRQGARTVYDLCQALFPSLSLLDTFLAVSEVVGHLDLLEEKGLVRWEKDGEIWRVEPA